VYGGQEVINAPLYYRLFFCNYGRNRGREPKSMKRKALAVRRNELRAEPATHGPQRNVLIFEESNIYI